MVSTSKTEKLSEVDEIILVTLRHLLLKDLDTISTPAILRRITEKLNQNGYTL